MLYTTIACFFVPFLHTWNRREEFDKKSRTAGSWFNRLVDVRWRVDVTISSSVMNRVFKPVILLQFELSNGQVKTFEVSLQQFNELRLQVATVLNEMNLVESHPVMKIE